VGEQGKDGGHCRCEPKQKRRPEVEPGIAGRGDGVSISQSAPGFAAISATAFGASATKERD
jgi:hypothetical protein